MIVSGLLLLAFTTSLPAQSLLKRSRSAQSVIADQKAVQLGDILTVIIEEQQLIANSEDSQLTKKQNLEFKVDDFDVKRRKLSVLPNIAQTSDKNFEGEATYNKKGRFEARLAAVVVDVQPNGQLVIEGRRKIRMDRETKILKLTGIVRPRDIAPDNSIRSRYVANATIEYIGEGPLTRNTNQGWFEELLDVLWPF